MIVRTEADGPIVPSPKRESAAPWLSNSFSRNNEITFGGEPYCPPDLGYGKSDEESSDDGSNVANLTQQNSTSKTNSSLLSSDNDLASTQGSMSLNDIENKNNNTHHASDNNYNEGNQQQPGWKEWAGEQNMDKWKTSARNVAGTAYTRLSNIEVPETFSENISKKSQDVTNLLKDGSTTWKHLLFLYIVLFMTFILACVGIKTSSPSSIPDPSSSSSSSSGCAHSADLLWGDAVITLQDGSAFQVVGGDGLTWKEASFDAGTRCYGGKTGSLAAITNAEINDLLHRYLYALGGDDPASDESTPSAWIGGIELSSASSPTASYGWVSFGAGGTGLTHSSVFWSGEEDGTSNGVYVNWRLNQPISTEASESMGGQSLGCVEMDGVSGFWNTASCMSTRPYFLVQFK